MITTSLARSRVSICRHPGGCAFTIEDALIAMRWATLVPHKRYRVIVTPCCEKVDEVIEVHIPNVTGPAFTIRRTAFAVLIVDRLGMAMGFYTLTDALLAMAPLTRPAKRELLKTAKPPWLPFIPSPMTKKPGSLWNIVFQYASCIAAGSRHAQFPNLSRVATNVRAKSRIVRDWMAKLNADVDSLTKRKPPGQK